MALVAAPAVNGGCHDWQLLLLLFFDAFVADCFVKECLSAGLAVSLRMSASKKNDGAVLLVKQKSEEKENIL